ncbi:MAG: hypothetical protein ACJAU0_002076 [Flavobacteriales bacterium]|jgi:hypothetical protein
MSKDSTAMMMKLITERAVVKQDVYACTKEVFTELKSVLSEVVEEVQDAFGDSDERVQFYFKDKGDYEAEVKIAGDVLIFYMHTNVFQFDKSSSIWKTSYLEENELNGYVGVINIYNFLADSFKFQRMQDSGYMIGRLFVNRENHFKVQGKRQLGYLFNDFVNGIVSRDTLKQIVHSAIIYTLGFDLYAPPYKAVQQVTVGQIEAMSSHLKVATGKRLGFKFSNDDDIIE